MNTGYYFLYGTFIFTALSIVLAVYCNVKDRNMNEPCIMVLPWIIVGVCCLVTWDIYRKVVIQWGWPFWG